jgi:hypothetical protein
VLARHVHVQAVRCLQTLHHQQIQSVQRSFRRVFLEAIESEKEAFLEKKRDLRLSRYKTYQVKDGRTILGGQGNASADLKLQAATDSQEMHGDRGHLIAMGKENKQAQRKVGKETRANVRASAK